MIDRKQIKRIGQLLKPHGVNGEMALSLGTDLNFIKDPLFLICSMDGILVPFFLESIRKKSSNVILVKLEDVNTIEDTRRFQGVAAFISNDCFDDDSNAEFSWDMFIGYKVYDRNAGNLGTVVAVDDSTVNVLFLIKDGERERVIPANDVWIENIDTKSEIISYNLPDGVADL
jgi:16S rRNA processing protein RimM